MKGWGPRMQQRQTERVLKAFYCPHEKERNRPFGDHQAGRGGERLAWHSWQTLQERARAVSCSQGRKKRKIHTPEQLMQTKPHVGLFSQKQESRVASEQTWKTIRGVIWSQTDLREKDCRDPTQLATGSHRQPQAATPSLPGPGRQRQEHQHQDMFSAMGQLTSSCAAGGGTETPSGSVCRPLTNA